jgi:hypothetical protein
MASAASQSPELVERRVTDLLKPYFADLFVVNYHPSFPRPDRSTFSLFQVVFAVGPGEDSDMRAAVHGRFGMLLRLLSPLPEVQSSDVVLRARRHVPSRSRPDHPHMFIECAWHGSKLAAMYSADFTSWHSHCDFYINRFDRHDPLNIDTRNA